MKPFLNAEDEEDDSDEDDLGSHLLLTCLRNFHLLGINKLFFVHVSSLLILILNMNCFSVLPWVTFIEASALKDGKLQLSLEDNKSKGIEIQLDIKKQGEC